MQLQRIELKKLGTTERILRSDTQGNFDELENAVNSNAGTTEAWYKQLSGNLAAETANRQAADAAEANARKAGDDNEARDRRAADEKLEQELRSELLAGDHALDHKYAAESERLDQADIDIKALIASVGKQLNTRIDNLANDMRAADESNLAAMTAKAERVAVGSDGPTFIRMLGRALHDPKIRDVVASIVKE